ncbi:hypothetical protein BHM03_00009928 [Ensete ventricosum]|nr:hypothetical protein BHM03_00009928 [Ensete ventricosum]
MHIPNPGSKDLTLILFPTNGNIGHKALDHPPPPSIGSTRVGCNYFKTSEATLSTRAKQSRLYADFDLGPKSQNSWNKVDDQANLQLHVAPSRFSQGMTLFWGEGDNNRAYFGPSNVDLHVSLGESRVDTFDLAET